MLKKLNDLQNAVNQVVNKVMRENLELRLRKRLVDFSKKLKIDEINDEVIHFSMGKDFYEDDLSYREFALYGRYGKTESENANAIVNIKVQGKEQQFEYTIAIDLDKYKAYGRFEPQYNGNTSELKKFEMNIIETKEKFWKELSKKK